METDYHKWNSAALGRDMECKVYGHAGRPLLFIPCQDGRFYDFENYRMADTLSPWIDTGKVMVFSVDTVDKETWSDKSRDARWRIRRYEQWIGYITDEVVPFARDTVNRCNGWDGYPGVMVFGCSLGATHSANLYFRRPDLFDGLLALSGIYSTGYGFGDYMDEVVCQNSTVHFLSGLPKGHPYIGLYGLKKAIICTGQGPWELPDYTRQLQKVLDEKKIAAWVDYWGHDCSHDWYWWHKQAAYFMPYLLGEK